MAAGLFRTYNEGELSADEMRSGLRTVSLCGCFAFVWMAIALGMPLTLFMVAIGASGVQIGLTVAAQQLPLMLQIPASLIVERLPSRKPIWFALAVSHRALWFTAAALPFVLGVSAATPWLMIGMILASFILGHMSAPIWQGWMADMIPPSVSARYWGVRQAAMTFTFVLAVWLSGLILDHFKSAGPDGSLAGFGILFGIAAFFGTLDICVHLRVPEPTPKPAPKRASFKRRLKLILMNRDFVLLTCSMALWYFVVALTGAFTPVCLKRDFAMNYTQISVFIMAASFGAFLMSIPLGKLSGRFGSRSLCALCMIIGPSLMLAWYFAAPGTTSFQLPLLGTVESPSALALMLPFQIVSGGLYAGVSLYQYHLAGTLTRKKGRTFWMACHWFPIGAASALSPLAGGFLMDLFNSHPLHLTLPFGCPLNFYHVLLLLAAAMAWLAAFVMLKVKVKGAQLSLSDIFKTLRTANPFRAVVSAYGMAFSSDARKGRK